MASLHVATEWGELAFMPDVSSRGNALDPERMSPEERLREVGEILAAGLLRLRAKRAAEGGHRRESSLDFAARQSVHGRKLDAEKTDE